MKQSMMDRGLIKKIIAYCYEVSTQTNTDDFFDYMPHIRAISIRIYPDGWSVKSNAEHIKYKGDPIIFFNNDFYGIEGLEYVVRELKRLYYRYKCRRWSNDSINT